MSYRRWFYTLVPNENKKSLLDVYSVNDLNNKVVVCKQSDKGRQFTIFEDYLDFGEFYNKEPQKWYYEIILGEFSQKPHFDIDLSFNEPRVLEHLVTALLKVFKDKFNIELSLQKDLLIFTSHSANTVSTGTVKYSYHVIVDNYCSVSNDESRCLYNEVLARVPNEYKAYIDKAVYNSRQQFRIVHSSKFGSDRVKVHSSKWSYKGQDIVYQGSIEGYDLLFSSLISQTKLCRVLSLLDTNFDKPKFVNSEFEGDMSQVEKLLNDFDPNHRIVKQENGLVVLKHLRAYHCKVCDKSHTNENPFLTIYNGKVWFHCRRARDGASKKLMGHVDTGLDPGPDSRSGSKRTSPVKIPDFDPGDFSITDSDSVFDKVQLVSSTTKGKTVVLRQLYDPEKVRLENERIAEYAKKARQQS